MRERSRTSGSASAARLIEDYAGALSEAGWWITTIMVDRVDAREAGSESGIEATAHANSANRTP
jgi:hypothetical protein